MAGNNNPWRDIFSPAEWMTICTQARAAAAQPRVGVHRAPPQPPQPPQPAQWGATPSATPAAVLQRIGTSIAQYDQMPKDDSANFLQRAGVLKNISTQCTWYLRNLAKTHVLGAKQQTGKALNDQIDVWVNSLGSRALKKAAYLETMAQWHVTAKAKYKDRTQLSAFLRGLAGDNSSDGGTRLHATPYATLEKIDPFHRQTFVFLDTDESNRDDQSANTMGEAFIEYLSGLPASLTGRDTNINSTFYEWLEYHQFCIGTPGLQGDIRFKSPNRIRYDGHDLGLVYLPVGGPLAYTRLLTDAGARYQLNTTEFRPSGKGPTGACAFVWDGDGKLLLHEHGWDGFIHASAKQGKKIRCSGMLVALAGKVTCVTNESGHYAPNSQSIYEFVYWLWDRKVLAPTATVEIGHDAKGLKGTYPHLDFLRKAQPLFPKPTPVPYLV